MMEPSYKTRPFVSSPSQNLMRKQRKNSVSLTFLSTFHSGEKTMAYCLWTGQQSFNPVISVMTSCHRATLYSLILY